MRIVLKALVTISLFLLIFQTFDIKFSSLVTNIKDWRYLLASVFVPLIIVPFVSVNRWQSFLKAVGIREGFFVLWRINWISMFQGIVLPSSQGFDLLRIYHLEQRHPEQQGVAGCTVFIERMMGIVLLCCLSLGAVPFLVRREESLPLLLTVVAIFGAVVVFLVIILSKKLHAAYTGRTFQHRMIARVFKYIDAFHGAVVHFPFRKVLPFSLVWIAVFQLSIVFTIYLVFRAYGYDLPFIQHLAIFPIISVLTIVPITIGGFGVREGFFVYFYSLVGVPPSIAVGASVLQYIIVILLPASLGGGLVLWEYFYGLDGVNSR